MGNWRNHPLRRFYHKKKPPRPPQREYDFENFFPGNSVFIFFKIEYFWFFGEFGVFFYNFVELLALLFFLMGII